MESKQNDFQTLNKPQSSKTHVLKTPSELSLTPSQATEQAKINARKNPLDALSRSSLRNQGVEKRSGLQDVDDEYFKKNMFSRSNLNKHSGLNENYDHPGHINSMAQGDAPLTQMQHQSKQQPNPHLTQIHPTSQSHQSIQQLTETTQLQQQPHIHQSQKPPIQMQGKNPSYKESHLATDSQKPHYQQQQPMQLSVAPVAEPDLCTTCPNCQTTIYLVRGHETSGEPAQGSTPIRHDTTGNAASN